MSLDQLRLDIDRIDHELLRLLAERQRVAAAIGDTKRDAGRAIYAPDREEALLRRLEHTATADLPAPAIRSIFREIISASVGRQLDLPVVFLGPEGTFTHQAARKNFGGGVPLKPLRDIDAVFSAVTRGEASYGVVPVENANEGTVGRTLDLLAESDLKIVTQIYLPIEQCLVGNGPLSGVTRVLSKDIALEQCREWLARHLPKAELVAVESTAAAVREAAANPACAAVASSVAAELHHVPVLAQGIQDKLDNVTRFLVLAREPLGQVVGCENKSSVVFALRHEPGALQRALAPFSTRGINLTRVESRPNRQQAWEYLFFVDFIGHRDAPEVQAALTEIAPVCQTFKWLGSYPNLGTGDRRAGEPNPATPDTPHGVH